MFLLHSSSPEECVVIAWYTHSITNPFSHFHGPVTSAMIISRLTFDIICIKHPPLISTPLLSPEINKCSKALNQGSIIMKHFTHDCCHHCGHHCFISIWTCTYQNFLQHHFSKWLALSLKYDYKMTISCGLVISVKFWSFLTTGQPWISDPGLLLGKFFKPLPAGLQ